MIITVEISHYPLKEDYESNILAFIRVLKSDPDLTVFSNSMSTYVKGETQKIFKTLVELVENKDLSSTVIKVINRDLPIESGFLEF